jgi:hypothetical protein
MYSLGDQLARWTSAFLFLFFFFLSFFIHGLLLDDVFKSTVHRARNPKNGHRYSIPLFFGTDHDVRLEVGTFNSARIGVELTSCRGYSRSQAAFRVRDRPSTTSSQRAITLRRGFKRPMEIRILRMRNLKGCIFMCNPVVLLQVIVQHPETTHEEKIQA